MVSPVVFAFRGDTSGLNFGSITSGITSISTGFLAASSAVRTAGKAITSSIRLVNGAIDQTVGKFAEFEANQLRIQAAIGANTQKEAKELSKVITRLGVQYRFTIGEVQGAAEALAQLGTAQDQLEPTLTAAIKIASVTGTDLPQAAEIAKKAMNAFGISSIENSKVLREQIELMTTQFIQAHTESAATVQRLGQTMKAAGPAANVAGQNFKDVVPILEAMIDRGESAATAGVRLRRAMVELTAIEDSNAVLQDLGLKAAQLNPELNDLQTVFERLADAGLTTRQAIELFGKEHGQAIKQVVNLSKAGEDGTTVIDKYAKELNDVASANEKIKLTQSGIQFEWDQLVATADAGSTAVGGFVATFLDLEERMKAVRDRFGSLVEGIQDLNQQEIEDLTMELFSEQNLTGVLLNSWNNVAGPVTDLVTEAFLIGARQMLEFGPLIGVLLAKAAGRALDNIVGPIGRNMAKAMTRGVASAASLMVRSMTGVLSALPGMSFTAAAAITGKVAGEIEAAGERLQKNIEAGTSKVNAITDIFEQGPDAFKLNPKEISELRQLGENFANSVLGEGAGRAANALDDMRRAAEGARSTLEKGLLNIVDRHVQQARAGDLAPMRLLEQGRAAEQMVAAINRMIAIGEQTQRERIEEVQARKRQAKRFLPRLREERKSAELILGSRREQVLARIDAKIQQTNQRLSKANAKLESLRARSPLDFQVPVQHLTSTIGPMFSRLNEQLANVVTRMGNMEQIRDFVEVSQDHRIQTFFGAPDRVSQASPTAGQKQGSANASRAGNQRR